MKSQDPFIIKLFVEIFVEIKFEFVIFVIIPLVAFKFVIVEFVFNEFVFIKFVIVELTKFPFVEFKENTFPVDVDKFVIVELVFNKFVIVTLLTLKLELVVLKLTEFTIKLVIVELIRLPLVEIKFVVDIFVLTKFTVVVFNKFPFVVVRLFVVKFTVKIFGKVKFVKIKLLIVELLTLKLDDVVLNTKLFTFRFVIVEFVFSKFVVVEFVINELLLVKFVVTNPEILKQAYRAGMEIGVHTWTHPHLTQLTNEQIVSEIMYTFHIVKDILGVDCRYVRAPYGDTNDRVRGVIKALGFVLVSWNRDTNDAVTNGVSVIPKFDQFMAEAVFGTISLEHDLHIETASKAPYGMNKLSKSAYVERTISQCTGEQAYGRIEPFPSSSQPNVGPSTPIPSASPITPGPPSNPVNNYFTAQVTVVSNPQRAKTSGSFKLGTTLPLIL
ncbi:chitin deacetylase, partial [Terramyces sp. JEL0728]